MGEWQRIAVARAFTRELELLILDEPNHVPLASRLSGAFTAPRGIATHGRNELVRVPDEPAHSLEAGSEVSL